MASPHILTFFAGKPKLVTSNSFHCNSDIQASLEKVQKDYTPSSWFRLQFDPSAAAGSDRRWLSLSFQPGEEIYRAILGWNPKLDQ